MTKPARPLAGIVLLICALAFKAAAQDADALVKKMDLAMHPENYYGLMEMKTVKPSGETSSMAFETYYKHDVGSRMELTAPARSKGIRFLQRDNSLWLFNPRSGSRRAIRLSARDSFQGSAFSNSDVSDTEYHDNYSSTVVRSETLEVDGALRQCTVIEALARDRFSPYAKILIWMDAGNNIPYRMDYYAHSGLLFKRMTLSRLKEIAGRQRPTLYHMESFDQPGLYSEVALEKLEARSDLPDRLFTQADLTQ